MYNDLPLNLRILFATLPNGIATRAALTCLGKDRGHTSNVIKSLIDFHFLEEKKMKIEKSPRTYEESYLAITPAGFRFLIAQTKGLPLFENIPNPVPPFSVRARASNEVMLRTLSIQDTAILLRACGVETELSHMQDSTLVRTGSLREIIRVANASASEKTKKFQPPIFLHSIEVSAALGLRADATVSPVSQAKSLEERIQENSLHRKMNSTQNVYSPYTGMIITQDTAYLTYRAGHYGMPWHGAGTMRFAMQAGLLANKIVPACTRKRDTIKSAFLFLKNAHQFSLAYLDSNKKRNQRQSDNVHQLGYPFAHLHAIPLTRDGLMLLSMILQYGANFDTAYAEAHFGAHIQKRTGADCKILTHMLTAEQLPLYLGYSLDIRKMQRLQKHLEVSQETTFGILCFPWQEDYYKHIFPTADFYS